MPGIESTQFGEVSATVPAARIGQDGGIRLGTNAADVISGTDAADDDASSFRYLLMPRRLLS